MDNLLSAAVWVVSYACGILTLVNASPSCSATGTICHSLAVICKSSFRASHHFDVPYVDVSEIKQFEIWYKYEI